MKVKIGNKIYDSKKEPIVIELDEDEKKLISNMGTQNKFCSYPEGIEPSEIKKFMNMKG